MKASLLNHLPERSQLIPVAATVVFVVFTWTIYHALYQVPGWLYYMGVLQILILFAYLAGYALVESLLVTVGLVIYCLVLPTRWLKQRFTAEGILLASLLAGTAYILRSGFDRFQKQPDWQLIALPLAALLGLAVITPGLAWLLGRFPRLERGLETLGRRLTIFSSLYIPLGLLGWLVVAWRNLPLR